VSVQETSDTSEQAIFWQYHYPVLDVTELDCSVRSQGHTNPAGEYTMCGSDLQDYIDKIMPPPPTGQIALTASADTTLLRDQPNRNDGADAKLGLGGRGTREFVVRFSGNRISKLLAGHELVGATLRLSQVRKGRGARLEIQPLADAFVEGNGNLADADWGTGAGATWNCAEDADISDDVNDCLVDWSSRSSSSDHGRGDGSRLGGPKDGAARYDWRKGQVSWDVTDDLRGGIHAWLVRVLGRRGAAYVSREGAVLLPDPARAPTLLLDRQTVVAGSDNAAKG
jgi:hypothetical protein